MAFTLLKPQWCSDIHKLLHVADLTGPSSGSAQLHKTIVKTFVIFSV